ncbi:CPBP family intramembrane metalloprotease [Auraticoccus sp. F435]|uniref:CPBP family intramembrane metalloprotease n=1 Tax=Auraticoccus cholistanensis TaxID=2656650 RepID=A0A6A9V087_9ACTN|nr:CPBP family intramembrane glutamic endopeptidase [Auraticoccus cholistanensis]MVA74990.1 CPBP family intramembrane metalloprotease [Auraticoccus cholistanensis]
MTSTPPGGQPPAPLRRPLRDVPTVDETPAPPPAPAGPVRPSPLPVGPTEYHHFLRTPRSAWWRGALAVVLTCVLFLVVQVVLLVPLTLVQALTGTELLRFQGTTMVLTPTLLAVTNVSIAAMIPISMLLQRSLFGQPARWLHSVHGRFRWRFAARLTAVLLPVWLVYAGLLIWLFPEAAGAGGAAPTLASTLLMLAVVVVSTPFQAAGEEYAARGLLARSFGSWFASPRLALIAALVGPNLLFMVAHGAGDWTLALYYLFFGLACTVLVWRTGGLEAAVVLHAVNNTTLFGLSAFVTSEVVIDRSAGSGGAMMLIPAAMIALTTAALWWWSHRAGTARAADPQAVGTAA